LRVYENNVLRRILKPEREEVAGGWKKLHKEELHNYYSNQINKDVMGRSYNVHGEDEKCMHSFGWKTWV
jgi:hypothetical protein